MAHSYDPYENVRNVMSDAAKMAGIDSPYMEIIKCPQRETKVYLPVEMDDGSVHVRLHQLSVQIRIFQHRM